MIIVCPFQLKQSILFCLFYSASAQSITLLLLQAMLPCTCILTAFLCHFNGWPGISLELVTVAFAILQILYFSSKNSGSDVWNDMYGQRAPHTKCTTHIKKTVMSPGTWKKEENPHGRFPKQVLKEIKMFISTKLSFSFMF